MRRFVRRLLTPPMLVLAALFLLWEEWLWVHLETVMSRLAKAPALRKLETRIARLPPAAAMATFLTPSILLFPVNLAGIWLTAQGRPAAGTSLLIAAKLVGTAVVAHLFRICRPALLSLGWFRWLHDAFLHLRSRLYHSEPWLAAVAWKNRLARRLHAAFARSRRSILASRWHAIRARLRR
jgi:hypothetical protein